MLSPFDGFKSLCAIYSKVLQFIDHLRLIIIGFNIFVFVGLLPSQKDEEYKITAGQGTLLNMHTVKETIQIIYNALNWRSYYKIE